METTGARVKALRKLHNLKQDELGDKLGGLSYSQISAIESDRSAPVDTLNAIAKLFKVSAEWLINGTGEKPKGIVIPIRKELGESPWKDEAYQRMKEEIVSLRENNTMLLKIIAQVTGGKAANFLKASTKAGVAKVISIYADNKSAQVGVNA